MMQPHSYKITLTALAAIALAVLLLSPQRLCAQHIHLNAGASNTTQNAQLYFVNGVVYGTNAGYDVYLTYTNAGSFSNLYQGAGVSFTALASTPNNGGPRFRHAAEGAYLELQFVSVSGPKDGVFGVWEEEYGNTSVSYPLFTIPVGTTSGTNQFNLSEGDSSPGSDPHGHVHGRSFTANVPGLYTLGCKIFDTSTNGANGGPIHTPSDIYYLYFQAGVNIASFTRDDVNATITFGTGLGGNYYVQSTTNLADVSSWQDIAGSFPGNNRLQTTIDTNVHAAANYYRLRLAP